MARNLVHVDVLGDNGQAIVFDHRASNYSTWVLFWEEERKLLWYYSGDIGTSCWDFNLGDKTMGGPLEPGSLEKPLVPAELVPLLPDSLKREWGAQKYN